jgi:hypothetical protein
MKRGAKPYEDERKFNGYDKGRTVHLDNWGRQLRTLQA